MLQTPKSEGKNLVAIVFFAVQFSDVSWDLEDAVFNLTAKIWKK